MEIIIAGIQSLFLNVGPFFILLGLLIFVHEFGHFAVAKFFGVRVEVFSLGFGKKIFQHKRGDTNYAISLIPLGGYVKMFGDDPSADVSESDKAHSFLHKPVLQRFAIVLAGPAMNLFFAALLFFLIAMVGEETSSAKIGDVPQSSLAYEYGFRSGDKIEKINNEPIEIWKQAEVKIQGSINKSLRFEVAREGSGETVKIEATPRPGENQNILATRSEVGTIPGLGLESLSTLIGVQAGSPAAEAGLRPLDLVLEVNGSEIYTYRNLQSTIANHVGQSQPLNFKVKAYSFDKQGEERLITLNYTADELLAGEEAQVLSQLGIEPAEMYVLKVKDASPAAQAGMQPGDKLVEIDGKSVQAWPEVIDFVKNYRPEQRGMEFTFISSGQTKTSTIVPEMTDLMTAKGQEESRFTIGVVSGFVHTPSPPVLFRTSNPIEALAIGLDKTVEWTGMLVMGIVRLVQGDVSLRNIGGVITIGRFASHSFEAGLSAFMKMMAIISLNLFLINLLPIPVLDGGHLVFFSIEALKGTPLSMRKMEIAQQVGLVILITLMVFSFYNDINNFFFTGW